VAAAGHQPLIRRWGKQCCQGRGAIRNLQAVV
jgi:hypothetical protein